MKKTFFAIIIGLGFVTGLGTARAQTDEKPAPKPKAPFLAEVPDYGHWTVTFKYGWALPVAPPAATSRRPCRTGSPTLIDTIKTGDLRGVTLTFPDGTSKQYTCQGDWVLASTPKGPQLGIATPTWPLYLLHHGLCITRRSENRSLDLQGGGLA